MRATVKIAATGWILALLLMEAGPARGRDRVGERYEGNPIAIADVTVIDVSDGTEVHHRTVVVRYGKIVYIKPAAEFDTPGWMTEVNGKGRFLIPGLWDAHVHLSFWDEPEGKASTVDSESVKNDYGEVLGRLAAWGITSVRDMGGDLEAIDDWRGRIEKGEVVGPTVLRAGPYVDGPKDNDRYRRVVTSSDEARDAVRELDEAGIDFLKIHSQVPPEAMPALAREARKRGLKIGGHVPYGTSISELIDWGVSTVEHADVFFISRLGSRQGTFEEWKAVYDWHFTPEGVKLFKTMASSGMWFTPTLAIFDSGWDSIGEPWDRLRTWYRDLAGLAHRKGVRLLAGTDVARKTGTVQPGTGLHDELEHLVGIGLEPWEALRAATLYPARAFGRESEVGAVEPGMIGDLVLLGGNPLDDIRETRNIEAIVLRGRLLEGKRWRAPPFSDLPPLIEPRSMLDPVPRLRPQNLVQKLR